MSAKEIAEFINNTDITLNHIRRAVHHLTKSDRIDLYNITSPTHRSIVGKFFESLVYELLLNVASNSSDIVSIVAKLSDAKYTPYDIYAPDGLWYSHDGEIRFRVDGRIVAEVDFLILTTDGVRVFGEVITNPAETQRQKLKIEIERKRELLSTLYGDPVECLIILSSNPPNQISNLSNNDAYAVILGGDTLYTSVHPNEVLKRNLSPTDCIKRVDGRNW